MKISYHKGIQDYCSDFNAHAQGIDGSGSLADARVTHNKLSLDAIIQVH